MFSFQFWEYWYIDEQTVRVKKKKFVHNIPTYVTFNAEQSLSLHYGRKINMIHWLIIKILKKKFFQTVTPSVTFDGKQLLSKDHTWKTIIFIESRRILKICRYRAKILGKLMWNSRPVQHENMNVGRQG